MQEYGLFELGVKSWLVWGACLALLAATPGRPQEILGQDLGSSESAGPTAEATSEADVPAGPVYHSFGNPAGKEVRHPSFDILEDTPAFKNSGTLTTPGGTCYGIAFVTQYWFNRIVLPDLDVDPAKIKIREVNNIELGITLDRTRIRDYRLRRFTQGAEGRKLIQKLAVSTFGNQELDSGTTRWGQPKRTYETWMRNLANSQEGLGFVGLTFESGGSHEILVSAAREGMALAPGASAGPKVTRFQIVDNNWVYGVDAKPEDHYLMYFHDQNRFSYSKEYREAYRAVGMEIQANQFVVDANLGCDPTYGEVNRLWQVTFDTTGGKPIGWGGATE